MTTGLNQEQISYVQSFLSGLEHKLRPVGQFTNEEFMYNLTRGEHAYYVFHLPNAAKGQSMTGDVDVSADRGDVTVSITCLSHISSDAPPTDVVLELRKIAADNGVGIYNIESPDPVLGSLIELGFKDVPMFPENKQPLTIDDFVKMVEKTNSASAAVKVVRKDYLSP